MSADTDPPYEICNSEAPPRILFLCDHASNRIPLELNTLGLSEDDLSSHIASDIGAGALTRALPAEEPEPAPAAAETHTEVVEPAPAPKRKIKVRGEEREVDNEELVRLAQ